MVTVAATMAWPAANVHAGSGFELRSQSATTLGSAQAGMTAGAADLTAMIFNPAALAYGAGTEGAIGATGLSTSVKFSETDATTVLGTPISGNQGGNAGTKVAVPNVYLATGLSDDVRLGLAVAPRFGLGSYWSRDWVGRYYGLDSKLTTVDLVPSISIKTGESLSFGLGVDVEYAKITTSGAIDFGTIDTVLTGGAFGGVPARSDGATALNAHGWGVGMVAGIVYEPRRGTRIGVDYHSQIRQLLHGDATFAAGGPVGQAIGAVTGAFKGTSLSSDFVAPATAAVGIYQEISPASAVMVDVKWTHWQALQDLQVTFGNPTQPPVRTDFSWHDSWFVTAGGRYQLSDRVALRYGVAYDQSPARDATRNPIIPDSDSYWVAAGLEYRYSRSTKVDAAYGHIFASDAPIGLKATDPGNAFRGNLSGMIQDSHVDYFAVQLVHRF